MRCVFTAFLLSKLDYTSSDAMKRIGKGIMNINKMQMSWGWVEADVHMQWHVPDIGGQWGMS